MQWWQILLVVAAAAVVSLAAYWAGKERGERLARDEYHDGGMSVGGESLFAGND